MKTNFFIAIFFFGSAGLLRAQPTADDWTKTDCQGNIHSLYADYLNNYQVVVMEFGMGCSTCGEAGQFFTQLKTQYAVSHPGQVKFFYMDYWTGNDCLTQIPAFLSTYALNFDAEFDSCDHEKDYYYPLLTPMPAYVICAGPWHTVYLANSSFNQTDTTLIDTTILAALTDMANVWIPQSNESEWNTTIYPNPANHQLHIKCDVKDAVISLTDITGRSQSVEIISRSENGIVMDVSVLKSGWYGLQMQNGNRVMFESVLILK